MTHILPFGGLCKRAPQKQLLNVYQEVEQRSVYTNWSKGHWGSGSIQIDTSWQSLCWLLQQVATLGPGKNILDSQAIVSSFRCNSGLYPPTHAVLCICVFAFIHLHPCCSKFFLLEGLTREQRRKGAPTTSLPPLLPHPPTVCNNRSPSLSSHRGAAVYSYFCIWVFVYLCFCICIVIHPPTVLPTEASLSLSSHRGVAVSQATDRFMVRPAATHTSQTRRPNFMLLSRIFALRCLFCWLLAIPCRDSWKGEPL